MNLEPKHMIIKKIYVHLGDNTIHIPAPRFTE